ncbi:hypothetical protein EPK99_04810 [Neorhizobium lilium]|uniref:Uncharacterized protein n=1 Tax=Neorhizobium lilium TaxID=2503024 RepID=A0A444LML1_9HYPH|nr:hypothetical protein [Neorhizobium lilium]RWX81599.1 hypothetical protein EPK99_04810 [Neorhizobium lilium]
MSQLAIFSHTQFIETEAAASRMKIPVAMALLSWKSPGMTICAPNITTSAQMQQAGYPVITTDTRGNGDTTAKWSAYSARAVSLIFMRKTGLANAAVLISKNRGSYGPRFTETWVDAGRLECRILVAIVPATHCSTSDQ